jgi:hypothetical protein
MATPTLGNVPTTINACDTDNWDSCDGTDTDIYKENSTSVAWIARGGSSDQSDFSVTNLDLSTEHIRIWVNHAALPQLDIESNGGMEFEFVDGANTGWWTLFGSDTYAGGWFNGIIYGGSSPTRNSGTAPAMTSIDNIGLYINTTGLAANKINTWIDYVRYGDGYYATGGTSGDEIELSGIVSQDVTNGYGITEEYQGVYYAFGELQIGNGATTTWFLMQSEVLVFADAPVNTGLYKIIGDGSGCRITIDDSVLRAAGSTDATRFLIDMDEANIVSFSMTDSFITRAGVCTFKSGQTVTNNVFDDCGQITTGDADLSNCTVKNYEGTAGTGAVNYAGTADPEDELDGMTFIKGTAATHAIQFGASIPSTINLSNMTFTGYNASDSQNDSTFYFADTSGTITLNLAGCSGNFTYDSAGCTVDIVVDPVTTTVNVKDISDLSNISGARVLVYAKDGTGDLNFEESITSIERSGSTATVTQTGHGLETNDKVYIKGATEPEYNGIHQVTYISSTQYSYTVSGTPSTPAGGTKTQTDVLISTTTDASGNATDTRSFTTDQPITGIAREGTDPAPNYRSSPIDGTVDSENGVTLTIFLVPD